MALREDRILYDFSKLPIRKCSYCLKEAPCYDFPISESGIAYRGFQCEECYNKENDFPDEFVQIEHLLPHNTFRQMMCLGVELSELDTYDFDNNCWHGELGLELKAKALLGCIIESHPLQEKLRENKSIRGQMIFFEGFDLRINVNGDIDTINRY